jgi:septum formation protein
MGESTTATLVLASASPRRRELLRTLGVEFIVTPSDVPEIPGADELPAAFAERVAREKAVAVAATVVNAWVLGADTIVVVDGRILGKPRDAADARAMLGQLSGRTHHVVTAVALVDPTQTVRASFHTTTAVAFHNLSAEDVETYVASGEPFGKAGAYAIQGGAARFVAHLKGSYSNVVGLPLDEVRTLLDRYDVARGGPSDATRPRSW